MARPLWRGAISFGLVNIPIRIFSAIEQHAIQFHLFAPDGKCRLRRKLVCPDTGKEYSYSDTLRGIEVSPDKYVIVEPEELEELEPESADIIELERFVDMQEIDPIYFNRTYFVFPDEGAEKAYVVLHDALKESGKAGIGEFVMRNKEYIGCIRANNKYLMLDTLLFPDEIRKPEPEKELNKIKATPKEVSLAVQLVDNLSGKFDPSRYEEDYRKKILKLLSQKKRGKGVRASSIKAPSDGKSAKVLDLMKRLEESLGRKKTGKGPQNGRKRKSA